MTTVSRWPLLCTGPLSDSGQIQNAWIVRGMAMMIAATVSSLGVVGVSAARTEVAARPTPSSTSAQDPVVTRAAVIKMRVAVAIPKAAMAIRTALPAGRVAHAWIAGFSAVIRAICRQMHAFSLVDRRPDRVVAAHPVDAGARWGGR